MGNPETMGLVQTEFGPMSGLLCAENSNPLAIFANIVGGTRIHAAGWPNFFSLSYSMKKFVQIQTQGAAFMTKSFVVSACSTLDDYAIKKLEVSPEVEAMLKIPDRCGGSMIADPTGLLIAGPMGNEEGILYADCDLSLCIKQKLMHDYAAHYNRPDIFTLIQRKSPYKILVEDTHDSIADAQEDTSDDPETP
jgi:aliphatic nitrilase